VVVVHHSFREIVSAQAVRVTVSSDPKYDLSTVWLKRKGLPSQTLDLLGVSFLTNLGLG